jgi:hypothetical protein
MINVRNTRQLALGLGAGALLLAAGTAAQAADIVALASGNTLHTIDSTSRKVTATAKVQGEPLLGVDVRPADGMLYGLTASGRIVTVDAKTGATTVKSTLSEPLASGATFAVDFNPVADRLRVISSAGISLRINVDDGKTLVDKPLVYAEADANKGKTPKVTAVAYSNSVKGTKETVLYDIDAATGSFLRQVPPNDGVLNTIGKVGAKLNGTIAFDILADGNGGNTGYLMTGNQLYTLDIATGATRAVGQVAGVSGVTDIAVMSR